MKVGKGEVGLEAEKCTYQVEETQVLRNRHMRNLSLLRQLLVSFILSALRGGGNR